MKKVIVFIAAILAAICLNAQEKGDMYISGIFNVSGGNTKTSTTVLNQTTSNVRPSVLNFGIAPQFGYFIIDNFEVNFAVGYDLTKSYTGSDAEDNKLFIRENLFSLRPGISYYFKLSDKFYYVPAFSVGIGFGNKSEDINVNTTEKNGVTNVDLTLSLLSFELQPTKHLGIILRAGDFGYNFSKEKDTDSTGNTSTVTNITKNSVSLGINLSTTIGFRYYF